jgi:riboflavin synthase
MFTGIIEGLGTVVGVRPSSTGKRISIAADFSLNRTEIGDSICVNGACLTAVIIDGRRFEADISPETIEKTTFSGVKIGDRVNLERALMLSGRIDGHLVSGHVDGKGWIRAKRPAGNATLVAVEVPASMSAYIIPKGSVAVDGISLTVNSWREGRFEVSVIPHTAAGTTITLKRIGEAVNIETDLIGKYVERFIKVYQKDATKENSSSVDMNLLARTGFLEP